MFQVNTRHETNTSEQASAVRTLFYAVTSKYMDLNIALAIGTLIGCFFALSWFAGTDAPYVPTKYEAIKKVLKLAGVGKGKKFYELGSGDGRVVIEAAKLGANATGIEQSWIRVLYSKYQASKLKISFASFCHGNVFNRDYSDADFVYIYLLIPGVKKLEKKLQDELKPGSIVITQTFHFPNWKPFKKINLSKEMDFSKDIKGSGDFWMYVK